MPVEVALSVPRPTDLRLHPVTALSPPMSALEREALKADIARHGVRVPIVTHRGQILDGRHRWEVCQELGLDCPSVEWDGRAPWLLAQSLNLIRRHLPEGQVASIAVLAARQFPEFAQQLAAIKAEAAARQRAGGLKAGRGRSLPSREGKLSRAPDAFDQLAQTVGVSGATMERAAGVAEKAPELAAQIVCGEITLTEALRQVKRLEVTARLQTLPPLDGAYRVLYADPPWRYQSGQSAGLEQYGPAARHYAALSIAELSALPVAALATAEAVLFLWVPSPLLADCWPTAGR